MKGLVPACADRLEAAARDRAPIARLTETHPDLDVDTAYDVQAEVARRRVEAGDPVVGAKLGLTSRAKQQQMNVAEPVYGVLHATSVHPAGEPIAVNDLIFPRVEPEIVFHMGSELVGPGVSAAQVIAATESVSCGLEVLDSRFSDYSFTAADVIADNTSAAKVIVGPVMMAAAAVDLALVGLMLEVDGDLVATSAGAATMGHPAHAVAIYANFLARRGRSLPAGSLVFSGGLTAAVALEAGSHVTATFGHLGSVTVTGV
ncbi:MAG: 2-keto-4-pentenoate hydratase [Acidimicrobiales bacterium]